MQRFNLMATSSFATLDAGWKTALASLHDDYFFRRQVRVCLACAPGLQCCPRFMNNDIRVWQCGKCRIKFSPRYRAL